MKKAEVTISIKTTPKEVISAFLLVYSDQELSVAMLSNLSFAGFGEKEAMEIANNFLKIIE